MQGTATKSWAIDLVSDTSTRPSAGMLAAMGAAEVGDEQRGEDPTTLALCARVAQMLGMDDALFLPSGTMCNQIAYLVHCRPGDEIIVAANAHVFGSEGAGASALAGAQFRPVATPDGIFSAEEARAAIRAPRHRSPRSRVISVEQTANRGGGSVWPTATLGEMARLAHASGLAAHMDGARLPNAAIASGAPMAEHTRGFDSAWIDLSKGLGCPVGAVLAGTKEFIEEAWYWKHRLGGAMRQSGYLAAAGLYALDHNLARLAEDHANARLFARKVDGAGGVKVFPAEVTTNILFLDLSGCGIEAGGIAAALAEQGIRLGVESPTRMRVVTHLDVGTAQVEEAAAQLVRILERAARAG
ncbi:threonine aldolase family protein [Ancylobacter mangrovi]|uniref:threonine aldolase family protein n=1 Tax=Ancylobacter mangrovi TaxID=2972472 RepID=UPI0021615112|nr:threonine aldolase family protein [Ancylobacter mangrovi]MCS0504608.1 beta-eliminating lyase-related protein [Ancylobacter mangrovi]